MTGPAISVLARTPKQGRQARPGAYRYYLGLSVAFGERRHDASESAQLIGDYLDDLESGPCGCTVIEGTGFYRRERERTLVIYVTGLTAQQHASFLTWLAKTFDQICVAYEPAPQTRLFFSGAVALPTKPLRTPSPVSNEVSEFVSLDD